MEHMTATTGRPGRGRPRVEGITRAILDATIALMTDVGIGALTMDAVAARSGVGKATIYRRWATKQDLVVAAIGQRIIEVTVPDLGDFRAELDWLLTERLAMYQQDGSDRLVAGLVGAAAEDPAIRSAAKEGTARLLRETRRVVERGIARGQVRPDVDARSVATMIAATLPFRMILELEPLDRSLVDDVVDLVVRSVIP
jgi:AcrR family transcriptional regulator